MKRGRIALFPALLAPVLLFTAGAQAQPICDPDQIVVTSNADTIQVKHSNATRNCCTELTLSFQVSEQIANFYEGDAGEPCRCTCCFNLQYDCHGFATGRYTVRIWNGDGSALYGESEVDVAGSGSGPLIGSVNRGECTQTPTAGSSWGRLRSLYR